jgi:hypothetical protein
LESLEEHFFLGTENLEEYIGQPVEIPYIEFLKNNNEKSLIVVSASSSNLKWSDFDIQGTCNKENLCSYVLAGVKITECSKDIFQQIL